jgi:hypothetical protein
LVGAASPYLEEHDHNPVDWYPWGEEALALARETNRPIFLSIGYSTCHWCHVMARESFEDDEIAAYLNEHYVAIKVDREARPDLDALFLDAVAALGSNTGWPLTVLLTPALEPFFGGTYFPPRRAPGSRVGLLEILREAEAAWRTDGESLAREGRGVLAEIEARARTHGGDAPILPPEVIVSAMQTLARHRDVVHGGFGRGPHFPNAPLLLAELRASRREGADAATRAHLIQTLDEMARGGVRDAVGGAFHRYSVDSSWHVPHFEKTLYDNAQLASLYVEAGLWLDRPDFVAIGRAVLDELIVSWRGPSGALVVGFDADDGGGEGAFYTWTPSELRAVLNEGDARFAIEHFGVTDTGELEGRSVLHARALVATDAPEHAVLTRVLSTLAAARVSRPSPHADDKELTGWNGLAIESFANVGRWLNEPRYVAEAERLARAVLANAWDGTRLLHGVRGSADLGDGFLDDHALLARGLLALHAATGDLSFLATADALASRIEAHFYDAERGLFSSGAGAASAGLPLSRPDLDDGVLPSGGTSAALLLIELGSLAGDTARLERGERVLRTLASDSASAPFSHGFALVAMDRMLGPSREIVIAGAPGAATDALLDVVRTVLPGRASIAVLPATSIEDLLGGALSSRDAIEGTPTAYVCEIGRCELPTSDPAVLARTLAPLR